MAIVTLLRVLTYAFSQVVLSIIIINFWVNCFVGMTVIHGLLTVSRVANVTLREPIHHRFLSDIIKSLSAAVTVL